MQTWINQSLDQRKNWFRQVATAYDHARPRYASEVIHYVLEVAQLPPQAAILEIGCGPATATVPFAKLGFAMTCLEPSPETAQLAQQNCADYANVEVINTSFEEWQSDANRFDAVLAATSFHWVSEEIKYAKTADILRDRGSLILLWNTAPQVSFDVYRVLSEVFQVHAPSLLKYEDFDIQMSRLQTFEQAIADSGYFTNLVSKQWIYTPTYSVRDYVLLLSTLSSYIALDPHQRETVLHELETTLEKHCGDQVETSYLSVVQIARPIKP